MLHAKPATKNIITALETNLNDIMKDQLLHMIIREELDCILISPSFKLDDHGQPHWFDLNATVFFNGQFKKVYKEIDKDK